MNDQDQINRVYFNPFAPGSDWGFDNYWIHPVREYIGPDGATFIDRADAPGIPGATPAGEIFHSIDGMRKSGQIVPLIDCATASDAIHVLASMGIPVSAGRDVVPL